MSNFDRFLDIPGYYTVGDSCSFSIYNYGFDGENTAIIYALNQSGSFQFEGDWDADDSLFNFSITPEQTEKIPPGQFRASLVFGGTDMRVTMASRKIAFAPDPSKDLPVIWQKAVLDKIECAILKISESTNQSVNINGQQFSKKNFKELQDFRDKMRVEWYAQLRRYGIPVDVGVSKKIKTRFGGGAQR